jgi:hypothetical protein
MLSLPPAVELTARDLVRVNESRPGSSSPSAPATACSS